MRKYLLLIVVAVIVASCSSDKKKESTEEKVTYPSQIAINQNKNIGLGKGDIAPELQLLTPDNELVSLSDFRGEYVLVDFWAAWCKPCRLENPNNIKLYNKYKDKGFEIFSVSLDQNKDAWKAAIKYDKLTWTQVAELGSQEAATLYQVQAIPFTVLLDKEGRIIETNLRGVYLAAKLQEIFGF